MILKITRLNLLILSLKKAYPPLEVKEVKYNVVDITLDEVNPSLMVFY